MGFLPKLFACRQVTLTKPKAKKEGASADVVVIREVGGSMAPLWHSYIEPGLLRQLSYSVALFLNCFFTPTAKTRGVLYVVDASCPETIGAATIYLIELLGQPGLDLAQVAFLK